jgi:16S rRNA (adenine1518-N6/adenine1519-N6)-dimethyltransferase
MPKYSQVFLADTAICAKITGALRKEAFDSVVEIGPGAGALTASLYPAYGGRMKAVEIDAGLVPDLQAKFKGLEVVNSDFLALDLERAAGPGRVAFIGNLPYECSTAMLEKVLAFGRFSAAVFMFQKEVARRITAPVGGSEYGVLTLLTGCRASSELLLDVKAGSFRPVPKVDSSVLLFKPCRRFPDPADENFFLATVKKSFMHRRKTLVNSLSLSGVPKAAAAAAVEKAGYLPTVRAQELTLEGFETLAKLLPRGAA